MSVLLPWLRETRDSIVGRVNPLLQGLTDGHIYSLRDTAEFKPQDGMQHLYEAGVVGTDEGFYFREAGVWVRYSPDTHTIASHDTDATGAELTELTDGSQTTLHNHAGAAGNNPLDKQWLDPATFGASAGTLNWDSTDKLNYRNFANGEDRYFGRSVAVPPGWTDGDSLKIDVHWRGASGPSNSDNWHCQVFVAGAGEDVSLYQWEYSTVVYPEITVQDDLEIDTVTVTTSGGDTADFMRVAIRRNSGDGSDDYNADVEFLGALFYF